MAFGNYRELSLTRLQTRRKWKYCAAWMAVLGFVLAAAGVRAQDLEPGNSRAGATLALPVDRQNSIKLHASTGVSTRTGSDFNIGGIAWQHRWGGGL